MLHTRKRFAATSSLETDLASLASKAAIALDDLSLGRLKDLTAVRELADRVSANLSDRPSVDLTTAVAVHRALLETPGVPQGKTVKELVTNAGELTDRLANLVKNDGVADPDEIKRLRSFCVTLSRSLAALRRSPYDRPSHPFRR